MKKLLFYIRLLWFCRGKKRIAVAVDISGSIDPEWFDSVDTGLCAAKLLESRPLLDGYLSPAGPVPEMKTLWVIAPGGAELDGSYPGKFIYAP